MNERFKEIRKALELSQEKFGERLGVTKTAISKIESGTNNPTDTIIKLLCNEYNVNEEWLLNGDGEMFLTPEELYADIVTDAMLRGNEQIRDLIIEASELNELQLNTLLEFIKSINTGKKK